MEHKLLVFGSRGIDNDEAEQVLIEHLTHYPDVTLLTAADPSGACEVARNFARAKAIPLTLFFLDAKRNGRGKYHVRSVNALQACDSVLFIYDGISRGTRNEIALAEKLSIPFTIKHASHQQDELQGWDTLTFNFDVTN
jgi:hypothetical protein